MMSSISRMGCHQFNRSGGNRIQTNGIQTMYSRGFFCFQSLFFSISWIGWWVIFKGKLWFYPQRQGFPVWILPSTNYETGGFNPPCAEKQPNIGARTCHSGWNTKWTNGTVLPPSRRLSPPTVSGTNEKEIGIVFVGPLWVGGIWILSLYIYMYTSPYGSNWINDIWILCPYIYMCVYTSPYGSKYYLRRYKSNRSHQSYFPKKLRLDPQGIKVWTFQEGSSLSNQWI